MQNLMLGWQQAGGLTAALTTAHAGAKRLRPWASIAPFLREAAVVAGLYCLWQLAGTLSVLGTEGAFSRARWIIRVQRAWQLPSELSAQRLILGHPLLEQGSNWYYAGMHFTGLGVLLVWLFLRHRDRYRDVRNAVVVFSAVSLLVQLIPVAPPRMCPELGFIDTAQRDGQSVYSFSAIRVDQLGAMPSVHVGWALLVAWAAVTISGSRWRWWVLAHPLLTVFVVVATANHFWLDGIVAAIIVGAASVVVRLRVRPDHRDADRAGIRHRGEGGRDLVQPDHASH
jgi:hypothetical protein